MRLLPAALSAGAGSVAGTQLAVRAGTKLIVTTGLVAMAAFYGWVAATASYAIIAAQMVAYGLGLGLTSAPATESVMGAISQARAGAGSAVNDSARLAGGALGVAVIGSVYASADRATMAAGSPAVSRCGRLSYVTDDAVWWRGRPGTARKRVAVVSVSYNTRELTAFLLWSLHRIACCGRCTGS